jgi:uncharacterized protein YndB with AHSA1/START domain
MSSRPASTSRTVSASTIIPARPEEIFDLLADPRRHPELDGSGTVRGSVRGPQRLYKGATFGMQMRIGLPYFVRNKVIEFEENRRIAWRHWFQHVWRYELEPVDGGTRVTETWDYGPAIGRRALELGKVPRLNQRNIERTLNRLRDRFGAERTTA